MPPTSVSSWAEDEEIVALVGAPILGVAGEAGAEIGAAQRVGRPARLPRRQEIARARPAGSPIPRNRRARAGAETPARRSGATARRGSGTVAGKVLRCGAIARPAPRSAAEPRPQAVEILELPDRPERRQGRRRRAPARDDAARSRRRRPPRCGARARRDRTACRGSACAAPSARSAPRCFPATSAARPSSAPWRGRVRPAVNPSSSLQRLLAQHRHQLGRLVLAGAGIDAEQPAVAIAVGEGVDRIDQAALFAHLLEQPRGHAAAERGRQHRGGVIVRVVRASGRESRARGAAVRDRGSSRCSPPT